MGADTACQYQEWQFPNPCKRDEERSVESGLEISEIRKDVSPLAVGKSHVPFNLKFTGESK